MPTGSQATSTAGTTERSVARSLLAAARPENTYPSTHEAKLRRDAFVRKLPAQVQEAVGELESLDDEVARLEEQFRKERQQLERKFEALYAPILARRGEVVADADVSSRAAAVPSFWLGAMKAETAVATNINSRDETALRSLKDITCSTLQESRGSGFCLQFHFSSNQFFNNQILSKTYYISGSDTEPILERAEGTEIRWKPGMNLTVKHPDKKAAGSERCPSFFNFFETLRLFSDPTMANHISDMVEADYEVGRAFKDKLVPHAVRWFTGEAEDSDDYRSEASCDDEDATDEFEAARLELALDAAVSLPQANGTSSSKPTTAAMGYSPEPVD